MVGLQANRSSATVFTIGRDYTGRAEYMAYEDAKSQFSTLQRNLNVRYVTLILLSVWKRKLSAFTYLLQLLHVGYMHTNALSLRLRQCWNFCNVCAGAGCRSFYRVTFVFDKKHSYCWQTARRVQRSVKITIHGTIPYDRHSFILPCYSNLVPKTRRFSDIRPQKHVVTLKSGSEVTQGHWKWYHSIDYVWFSVTVL